MPGEADRVHATAIAIGSRGALIRGPSGSGKSDLALRCLALGPSSLIRDAAKLVADDQVILTKDLSRTRPRLVASAPSTLRGRLAEIVVVADLLREGTIDRFPDPWPKTGLLGLEVPVIRLFPFENSSPLKLLTALAMADLPRVVL